MLEVLLTIGMLAVLIVLLFKNVIVDMWTGMRGVCVALFESKRWSCVERRVMDER